MNPLLIGLAVGAGATWLLGNGVKQAGEGASAAGSGVLKVALAGGAAFLLYKKVLK